MVKASRSTLWKFTLLFGALMLLGLGAFSQQSVQAEDRILEKTTDSELFVTDMGETVQYQIGDNDGIRAIQILYGDKNGNYIDKKGKTLIDSEIIWVPGCPKNTIVTVSKTKTDAKGKVWRIKAVVIHDCSGDGETVVEGEDKPFDIAYYYYFKLGGVEVLEQNAITPSSWALNADKDKETGNTDGDKKGGGKGGGKKK